jgi:hypothetical protein
MNLRIQDTVFGTPVGKFKKKLEAEPDVPGKQVIAIPISPNLDMYILFRQLVRMQADLPDPPLSIAEGKKPETQIATTAATRGNPSAAKLYYWNNRLWHAYYHSVYGASVDGHGVTAEVFAKALLDRSPDFYHFRLPFCDVWVHGYELWLYRNEPGRRASFFRTRGRAFGVYHDCMGPEPGDVVVQLAAHPDPVVLRPTEQEGRYRSVGLCEVSNVEELVRFDAMEEEEREALLDAMTVFEII